MLLRILTRVRHGRLRSFRRMWVPLRFIYRVSLLVPMDWTVSKYIGPYGPFKFHRRFAFSNFSKFGVNLKSKNRGFQYFIQACRGRTCVFDVGAHIGLVSLPASSRMASRGVIYSFEPSPGNVKYLTYHLKKNKISNVEVVRKLVHASESDSSSIFLASEDSDMNSIAPGQLQTSYSLQEVPAISIDSFCSENELRPELIKIDVEGAEISVLEGAAEVLQSVKPTLFLSVHPRYIKALGRSTAELQELLSSAGYTISDFDGNIIDISDSEGDAEYIVAPAAI